ncbi:polysaccharide deacetylase family protein [Terrisporobacter sp.]
MNSAYKRTKAFILSITLFFGTLLIIGGFVIGIKNICGIFQDYEPPINRVDTKENKVALTFDVAWGSDNIEEILDILDKHNIKATFFLVGSWVDDNEELVKEIHNRGHEIGNHSNTHRSFTDISKEEKVDEIVTTSKKIKDAIGEDINLFRPPFGNVNKDTMDTCKSLRYYTLKWDVDSGDWKNIGPKHVVERVTKNTKPGSIILFHANVKDVGIYLEDCITNLEKKRYLMVKVSKLIYKNNYKVDSLGVQRVKEKH